MRPKSRRKIAKGYPLTNIIFEDTQRAYLYQNGQVAMQADLTKRAQLTTLLITFFAYTEPAHEDFSSAVDDFKQRVPDLARGLVAYHSERPHHERSISKGVYELLHPVS